MIKKIILLIVAIILIAEGALIAFLVGERQTQINEVNYYKRIKNNRLDYLEEKITEVPEDELKTLANVEKKQKPLDQVSVGGWIPDWDNADGLTTVKNNLTTIKSVSPFWFDLQNDGELKQLAGHGNEELLELKRTGQIELIPTITCFNADILQSTLKNDETIDKHISNIVTQVNTLDVDGIDLDYESIYRLDKDNFFKFLTKLQIELTKTDKKLVFTVMPKWGDLATYLTFIETRAAQDYKQIGEIVDELRIMTYEYSGRTNRYYGPNAPISWMEDVVRYAIYAGVPREKIVLGVPTYSYDYLSTRKMPKILYHPILKLQFVENGAVAYYNKTIDELKTQYEIKSDKFNEEWGEAVLQYKFIKGDRNENRTVVYPNDKSIQLRKQLAADYGIKGVFYWRLGDEGSLKL